MYRGGKGGEEEFREGGEPNVSRQNPSIHHQTVWIQCFESGSPRAEGRRSLNLTAGVWFLFYCMKTFSDLVPMSVSQFTKPATPLSTPQVREGTG